MSSGRGTISSIDFAGAGAVVFAAGAGPGSGAERKLAVDRDGAIKLLQAASSADVPRYHGEVPREDVAAVLEALLQRARASRLILYVNAGEKLLEQALERLLKSAGPAPSSATIAIEPAGY
jgi:hypothetical protein